MRRRHSENIIGTIEDPHGSVVIFERNGFRGLRFSENDVLVQGIMNLRRPLDFKSEYVKQQLAGATCHPYPRSGLCLGLGIGAVPRLWKAAWPHIHIDVVEISGAVISAAREFFYLKTSKDFRVHHGNATVAVQQTPLHGFYDLVFIDCYSADAIPIGCRRRSFVEDCIRCLAPGGLLLVNLLPDRLGAHAVYDHMISLTRSPIGLSARRKTNHAFFGHAHEGLDLKRALRNAYDLDKRGRLPFEVAPELVQALPMGRFGEKFNGS